ncbi:MAG: reverse transcriptase family protein, partial [Oscillospiraceae bacterium]
ILDNLKFTSTGPDEVPVWFFRLAAPFISKSLAHVYSLSVNTGIVPTQWKSAIITPVAKVSNPEGEVDFRPISVTSVLSRKLEQVIVNESIYPLMSDPPVGLDFSDQYAFRPSGSVTAALIAIIDSITEILRQGSSAVLISVDFSKAFDRVRHKTLLDKIDLLGTDVVIYNWIRSYLENREHSTKFKGERSDMMAINSSVVQGSCLGPAAFSVAASDLAPVNRERTRMHKFADDVNLTMNIDNYGDIRCEIENIESWALDNNLSLNKKKTKEMIFSTTKKLKTTTWPATEDGIDRVTQMRILGVIMKDNLSMKIHVDTLLSECTNKLYAINLLKHHGLSIHGLQEVFRSKIISKLIFASPAWWGLTSMEDRDRINSFLRRAKKLQFYPKDGRTFEELCEHADQRLFKKVACNSNHVLHKFLILKKQNNYELRNTRGHSFTLPVLDNRNFFNRVL